MRVGLLASTGKHLDSFFTEIRMVMQAKGAQVFAASGTPAYKMPSEVIRGLTQSPRPVNVLAGRTLRKWARDNSLDVVVTNTATASALVRMAGLPTPIVYFCHGLHWNTGTLPLERLWQTFEGSWLRRTAGVITINTDDERWFAENADPGVVRQHFPSGVGVPETFMQGLVPPPPRPPMNLLWVGDFSARKRPELAVAVADHLRTAGVNFTLRMLGDGPLMSATEKLVEHSRLGEVVELVGRVNSTAGYVDGAHALLHTAKWEGLPRVLLEGVARRRVAVAFDVKGVRDIPGAMLAPDGDVEAMAAEILRLHEGSGTQSLEIGGAPIETSAEVALRIIKMLETVLHKGCLSAG